MALLLDEIGRLGLLSQASKAAKIDLDNARELVREMNESFRAPLVEFDKGSVDSDDVRLTRLGEATVTWYWKKFETVWSSILEERCNYY
jgi:molybdate transport repressor ModE-like protein